MFHRRFYESWISPPHDFSLDLYAYYRAVRAGLTIRRIPVRFGRRYSGIGHNDFLAAKLRLSLRTIGYSMKLRHARVPRKAESGRHTSPMLKIAHRINDPARLAAVPRECGIEIDLHGYRDRVVVHHDPFVDAVDLETWLDAYNHACVILNVKEEGIEARVRDIVLRRGIVDFFFWTFPFRP